MKPVFENVKKIRKKKPSKLVLAEILYSLTNEFNIKAVIIINTKLIAELIMGFVPTIYTNNSYSGADRSLKA